MKRPFTSVALVYICGILLAQFTPWTLGAALIFSLSLAILSVVWASARHFLLWPLIFSFGWVNFSSRTEIISPCDLRIEIGQRPEYLTLRGKISSAPQDKFFKKDEEETWRSTTQINVSGFRRGTNWMPATGEILAITPAVLSDKYCAGQMVEVVGVLKSPNGPLAEGLFDYKTFLRRQQIYYQLDVASATDWRLMEYSSVSFKQRFLTWAKITLQRGLPVEDEPLRLTWAMTLGWKTALTDEVSEPFMRSGTMHIFAISGLHIALIAGILISLLRVLRIPRELCGLIVIPLIWFYTGATGWQPSAIRSTIMMSIIIAGWSLKRPGDLINSLSAAAVIILVWQPQQLFQAGFQLSFFVVLSIGLLLPRFESIRQKLLKTDPMLPAELRPRWQRWLDAPIRFITMNFATSLAAWLGSLPLVAYYFHLFTPVSLLANMVIVPLSSLALMANLGSLICGNWFPYATELFNHSGWFLMKCMLVASDWFAKSPAAYLYVPTPSLIECAIYYLILFTALTGWLFAKSRRRWAFIFLGLTAVFWFWNWNAEQKVWRVTVLPLNGGESIYIDGPGQQNDLLIDCGNEMPAKLVTTPFLRARGINRLPQFLLTHGDLRNMGGASNIIHDFKVPKVFSSPTRFRSSAYRTLQEKLDSNLQQEIKRGDQIGVWNILHPDSSDNFSQGDDATVVLKGIIYDTTIIFLSDLGRKGQNALLERTNDLRADIVVTGLAREGEPLNEGLLDAIQPRLIIVTDSESPATERASNKLRSRLSARKIPILYCREAGAVSLVFNPAGWTFHAMKGGKTN